MSRRRELHTPEQIIRKLRDADAKLAAGLYRRSQKQRAGGRPTGAHVFLPLRTTRGLAALAKINKASSTSRRLNDKIIHRLVLQRKVRLRVPR